MSKLHNMFIRDGIAENNLAQVNANNELQTNDISLGTTQASALLKITDVETAVTAVDTTLTDKTQLSKITDGTEELAINASNEALVKDTDLETAVGTVNGNLDAIELNQTDKTQMTNITDGIDDGSIVANTDDDTNLDGENGLVVNGVLYGRIDADTIKPLRIDASTHSIQTIDYPHHEIHGGSAFAWLQSKQFSNGEIDYFVITTPNTTKWAHANFSISTEGEGHFELYENPTISAAYTTIGSAVSNPAVINLNRNSGTANTTLLQDATIGGSGVDGTRIAHIHITAGQKTGAQRGTGGMEIILKQNEDYLLILENKESTTNYFQIQFNWYEHTDKN